jgi:protein translocase SecG subunit
MEFFMFEWIEIIYMVICLIFIGLVLLQGDSGSGLENITGGNSSSKSKKIGGLTKFTASLGALLFCLTFYISYDNKNNDDFKIIKTEVIQKENINE